MGLILGEFMMGAAWTLLGISNTATDVPVYALDCIKERGKVLKNVEKNA